MQYDTKIRLDAEMVAAIDFARRQESDLPPRAEMIRRLLGKALAANLRQVAETRTAIETSVADQIAASKQRTAESRERTRKLEAAQFEKKLDAMSPTGRFLGRQK